MERALRELDALMDVIRAERDGSCGERWTELQKRVDILWRVRHVLTNQK